jgi:hypothetical protein
MKIPWTVGALLPTSWSKEIWVPSGEYAGSPLKLPTPSGSSVRSPPPAAIVNRLTRVNSGAS